MGSGAFLLGGGRSGGFSGAFTPLPSGLAARHGFVGLGVLLTLWQRLEICSHKIAFIKLYEGELEVC